MELLTFFYSFAMVFYSWVFRSDANPFSGAGNSIPLQTLEKYTKFHTNHNFSWRPATLVFLDFQNGYFVKKFPNANFNFHKFFAFIWKIFFNFTA